MSTSPRTGEVGGVLLGVDLVSALRVFRIDFRPRGSVCVAFASGVNCLFRSHARARGAAAVVSSALQMSVEQSIIPFNRPYMAGKELSCIHEAHSFGRLAGDGPFTKRCHEWLERKSGCARGLLTHSCTSALEMSAILLDIRAGDEIIMPSFTFVSTANAFVLRGATPVFVDIRRDTLNMDEQLVEDAITPRTRAIVAVHYAGVSCEMNTIVEIARRRGVALVEDAAQGMMATYNNRALGSIGDLGAYSFHETKNIISGEGGALLVNRPDLVVRAEVVREKGTDRSRFFRGQVDKYTWQDVGSSFLPGELIAAFLWAQLMEADSITARRLLAWDRYHELLEPLERQGLLARPVVPDGCRHNGHMYYVVLDTGIDRQCVLNGLAARGVRAVSHYVPLHSSPGGMRFGRSVGELPLTTSLSERLIRLPMWVGLAGEQQEHVVATLSRVLMARE